MPIQSRYYGQSTPVLTKNNIRKVQSYTPTTSQSITPSNISKDESSKSKWFKKSKLYDDGYDFGDFTLSALSTVGDFGLNFIKGALSTGEGILDFGRYALSDVADLVGADDWSDALKERAKTNDVDNLLSPALEWVDNASVFGSNIDQVGQGLGQIGTMIATGGAIGKALGTASKLYKVSGIANIGLSSAGSARSEAYQSGATDAQARAYGLISGAVEAGSEALFGGLGRFNKMIGFGKGTALDDAAAKALANKFRSNTGKALAEYTIKAGAEGLEEVASGLGSAIAKKLTYMNDEDLGTLIKDENLFEQFYMGALTSAIASAPSTMKLINRANQNAEAVKQMVDSGQDETTIRDYLKEKGFDETDIDNLIDVVKYNPKVNAQMRLNKDVATLTPERISKMSNLKEVESSLIVIDKLIGSVSSVDTMKFKAETLAPLHNALKEQQAKLNDKLSESEKAEKLKNQQAAYNTVTETSNNFVKEDLAENIADLSTKLDKDSINPTATNTVTVEQNKNLYDAEAQQILSQINSDATIIPEVAWTPEQRQVADILGAFGKRAVFAKNLGYSGAVNINNPSLVFVDDHPASGILTNASNKDTLLFTTGHELFHSLQATNPDVYNEMTEHVKSTLETSQITKFMESFDPNDTHGWLRDLQIDGKYNIDKILKNPSEYAIQNNALNQITEEMIANEFGAMFTDAKYMQTLQQSNPNLFTKIVNIIKEFFKSLDKSVYSSPLTQMQINNIRDKFKAAVEESKTIEKTEKTETLGEKTSQNVQKEVKKEVKEETKKEVKEETKEEVKEEKPKKEVKEIKKEIKEIKKEKPKNIKQPEVKEKSLPKKPETIGQTVKTIAMDLDTRYAGVERIFNNYKKNIGTKYEKDSKKSLINAYENYKKAGGDKTISEIENLINSSEYKEELKQKEARQKEELKAKLDAMNESAKIKGMPQEQTKESKTINDKVNEFVKNFDGYFESSDMKGTRQTFVNTISNSPVFKNMIKDNPNMLKNKALTEYVKKSNFESVIGGMSNLIEQGENYIVEKAARNEEFTPEDFAAATFLAAANPNDTSIATIIADKITNAAQNLQFASVVKALNPSTTVLSVYQRMLDKARTEMSTSTDPSLQAAFNEMEKNNGFTLSENERTMLELMINEANNYDVDSDDYKLRMSLINTYVANKIPSSTQNKVAAVRRLGMLANVKTLLRNPGANILLKPINDIATVFGSVIDKKLAKQTGIRTTGLIDKKARKAAIREGITEAKRDAALGINTSTMSSEFNFTIKTKVFNDNTWTGRMLNSINNSVQYLMDVGDRPFYNYYYQNSLQAQMKLNGVSEPTPTMIKIATDEALRETFKDTDNKFTKTAIQLRNALNQVSIPILGIKGGKIGLGDIVAPFVTTPANIVTMMYKYSPAAMLTVSKNAKAYKAAIESGKDVTIAQKEFVSSLSKVTVGSILYTVAYLLAKAGITTGGEDDDKDIRALMKAQGYQKYSIKIGDTYFSYDWAQPVAAPFAIMSEFNRKNKLNDDEKNILKSMTDIFSLGGTALYEESMLSSIGELFNSDDPVNGILNTIADVPASFVPTFAKHLADTLDSRQKYTYGNNLLETMLGKTISKIPFAKSLLPTKYDTLGNEALMYGDNSQFNIFKTMLSPFNINEGYIGKIGNEIMDIYNRTGDSTVIPQVVPNSIKVNGETIKLTNAQKSQIQKSMGESYETVLINLMKMDAYNVIDANQKAEVLSSLAEYAKHKGIKDSNTIPNYETSNDNYKAITNYMNKGLDETSAVLYKGVISKIKADKDEDGNTITGSQAGNRAYTIMKLPISNEQKNTMLTLISPNATNYETISTLSPLQTKQQYVDYYALPRHDYYVSNKFSRDDYDIATTHYNIDSSKFMKVVNDMANIKSDKDTSGNTIENSKRNKIIKYINSQKLSGIQQIYLYHLAGYSVKEYKGQLYAYINSLPINNSEKQKLWENLGFK